MPHRRAPLKHAAAILGLLAGGMALSTGLSIAGWAADPAAAPVAAEKVMTRSQLGSYLAGRVARGHSDSEAAARFYDRALKADPGNDAIIEQTFMMEITEGNWARAIPLAEQLIKTQQGHRVARFLLGLTDFKSGRFTEAEAHFQATGGNPIGDLTSNLARAWIKSADNKSKDAIDLLEQPKQPDWAQPFFRYHKGLVSDIAGRRQDARAAFERVYKADPRTLRYTLAYARHAANMGDTKLAQSVLQGHIDRLQGESHPMARALREQVDGGARTPLLITQPSEGLAEVFYSLGEALSGENGVGAVYLQLALYLQPDFPFALATLAHVHEGSKRYDAAIAAYDKIPKGSPLETSVEIRKALNLNQLERVEEAKTILEAIAKREPQDVKALDALGSIMRGHKRYADAVEYYNRAIAILGKPLAKHWQYYYARGTSYERLKKWPQAEADLKTALKLAPDQPLILNYLGYSWIDQNRNLKEGLAMIEKAVKAKPDDGYIVDSLGWAQYRLGNYKEAAKHLERAVELRPEDPVLNDHLGDALWRVGREREARFQWEQALTLKPEPDDGEKIRKKLDKGLPALARGVTRPTKEVQRIEVPKKRTENRAAPSPSVQ
jgi:tetratricopeptide (TPR) repeat protein